MQTIIKEKLSFDELEHFINHADVCKNPLNLETIYQYDNASRLTKKTLSNGVYTDYAYDNANQLTSLVNKKSDGTAISSFSYTNDNVGNRLSMTTQEGISTYTYDETYRLTSADHPVQADESFTYDKVGNRKTTVNDQDWDYDANNRLLSYNGFAFTYDDNGNTLTKSDGTNTTTYSWDYENRLTRVDLPDGNYAEYKYDPFGKRLLKRVHDFTSTQVHYYLYDNEDIIVEYDSTGAVTVSYVHGQGIDEPIKMSRGGVDYYYTMNGLGSVSELTDLSGQTVEVYKYNSFGKIEAAPTTGNPYTYTSREYDGETGLYFYRARYYDASVGRFLSEDPIGFEGGDINLFRYVFNNPIRFTDSSGQESSGRLPSEGEGPLGFDVGYGAEQGLIRSEGMFKTSCCDLNKQRHRLLYKKVCWGPYVGMSFSVSLVSGLSGGKCPGGLSGWSWEADFGFPQVGWSENNPAEGPTTGGLGGPIGLGLRRCKYELLEDKIDGCCT